MARILVVDDDPALLKALRLGLKAGGHDVVVAPNGEQGLTQTAVEAPDLLIVDLGLPDLDGIEVCRRVREWSQVPIIVLSAVDEESRKVAALDAGADDYVTKPFGMAELQARIRVALRRLPDLGEGPGEAELTEGGLHIDIQHHQADLAGRPIELTAKEFDLLLYLARHAGRTCTHEMILSAVWGPGYRTEAQYVHAYVHRLRQKLDDHDGHRIRSVSGIGYVFEPGT